MKTRAILVVAVSLVFCAGLVIPALAEDPKPISLPQPKLDSSKSLAQALKDRKTTREYSTEDLTPQMISNILWAATGINRPDGGRRTAPTAKNWQEVDVYISTKQGIYVYDPKSKRSHSGSFGRPAIPDLYTAGIQGCPRESRVHLRSGTHGRRR